MLLVSIAALGTGLADAHACETSWPEWDSFKNRLISADGRVTDHSSDAKITTSEGQAYALFFSLVANDRATFDKLLDWTENNLAQGDLASRLPAWSWGKDPSGNWIILDNNSASDADLWMAYTLGEAGRLWNDRRYIALSSLLSNRILLDETKEVPKLGLVLLPGIRGFTPDPKSVRLNPSYLPMQLMNWFANYSGDPRWSALRDTSGKIILASSPRGYAPEWTTYDYERGFIQDGNGDDTDRGSYNAIRVYLWAGMMHKEDPARRRLIDRLMPMGHFIQDHGTPPEFINIMTGITNGTGASGFSAAVIPFLLAARLDSAAEQQMARALTSQDSENNYYNQVLKLFALGWKNNIYQFEATGNLSPNWKKKICP